MDWNIIFGGRGYNIYNSLIYGFLIILITLIFLKLAKKFKIKIFKKSFLLIAPYIFYASLLRSLGDKGLISTFLLVSPTIWIVAFAIIAVLQVGYHGLIKNKVTLRQHYLISIVIIFLFNIPFFYVFYNNSAEFFGLNFFLIFYFILIFSLIFIFRPKQRKGVSIGEVYKQWAFLFLVPGIPAFYIILNYAVNYHGLMLIFLVFSLVLILFFLICKKINIDFYSKAAFIAHLWDASATYVCVDFFNFWEMHPLVRTVTNLTGTALSFFALKCLAIGLLLFLINKGIKNKTLRKSAKAAIFIMGIATGTRDAISLLIA